MIQGFVFFPLVDDCNKMSDSENSQPQDDSDEDIYKDIPEFNFEDELAKLEGSKENYKQEANDLSEKVKTLTEENKELKKSNEVLKKNLSTLLKTAQAEVQRKDSMIEELRTQVDSFTFRRNRNERNTKDKYTSTDDLKLIPEVKYDEDKYKVVNDKNRRSLENQTSSENELKSNREEKRKEPSSGKEKNSDCDSDRKSGKHSNFRHSESSHDRHRGKKSSRYEESSEYRRSYRKSHRDHSKSDSYDKKRHSRSSDSRFLSRHRHSRERKSDRRRRESSERRRRSEESSERSQRRKNGSRSRELSRGSKEPSIDKSKSRSSRDKDSLDRIKEQISNKPEVSNGSKGSEVADGRKSEKPVRPEDVQKSKQGKEKRVLKHEKRRGLYVFTAKSPLDALYDEMVTSRSSNQFSNCKSGASDRDSSEDVEIPVVQKRKDCSEPLETRPDEDWTLSFKNERQNDPKPMTLYSRRMMRKFSSEVKPTESQTSKKEFENPSKPSGKVEEDEKEPGELTDDENVVESSKEFQELAKVASIEIMEKPVKEVIFKEPIRRDFSRGESVKAEVKEPQKEVEKAIPVREDSTSGKEAEPCKETREVIEFSPFKNNYKLIEISPLKTPGSEHVLDFYNQRAPSKQQTERPSLDSSENLTESEKSTSKPSDTSDEKISETELKIAIPPASGSPKEKKSNTKEETKIKKDKTEDKKSKDKKQETKTKRKPGKRETEKSKSYEKNQKRKRKSSETDEGNGKSKKRKLEKSDGSEKKTRNKRNSETEPEPEPEPETEEKVKDDISSFEFFKPVAKIPQTPIDSGKSSSTTTDYKMTATMSVTGVVRLETPNKCVDKLKNLMINEHMIFNVLDSKSNSQFSPLIGSKLVEMTPRRMLKNDLMLTDSEDDSVVKQNTVEGEDEEMEEVEEEEDEFSGSENSECDSDSGASDFVDLL